MAYRQLCAVTFAVLGWVTVGCGGGTATTTATNTNDQQPPNNTNQPPSNADQATNPDKTPPSVDTPPASSEAPAGSGGGLSALCKKICSTLSTFAGDCSSGMTTVGMTDLCSADVKCDIPGDIPCQTEIADEFDCVFSNLADICSGAQGAGNAAQAQPCRDVGRAYTKCAQANGLTGSTDTPTDPGKPAAACTTAGGCACATDCATCGCKAGTDLAKIEACATAACAL